MPVVAVVNRKGGSGKSTLATHLAVHCASTGAAVMLGDVDRQQSTRTWLRQRNAGSPGGRRQVVGWTVDPRAFVRPPLGIDHVVLDTPGGLTGLDLARVVMYADAILMPVSNSIFDRESAAECLAELKTLPRVASGRCKLAAIGMRLDARSAAADEVRAWATQNGLALIASVSESPAYVRCSEKGLTVFDLPADEAEAERAQWKPILHWLRPILQPPVAAPAAARGAPILTAQKLTSGPTPAGARPAEPGLPAAASPMTRFLDALPIPKFLQRTP
jgi:chromosome partitioning protein